ncbi:MFS transporter [Paenibacillus abyssi]|uniref:Transporter YwbF n=1 Tax=Paenibacillus abyssi TaxID=1340531 RepID=A0A917CQZ6_9BACL|nr:MFS transporter [Paenibacillus abyssi]GGF94513.1 putative transporter YwbF [Paenibacillus abyssi]
MVRISAYVYLLFSTFSMMVFFFPLYLQNKGLDSSQIGAIFACGAFVSIFAQPFWGYVSDRTKTIKKIIIVILTASLFLSMGLLSMGSFTMIILFYAVFMFFNSASAPLTDTLTISYAHENNKDYGRIRLWGEVGVGISALLLGLLVERIGIDYLRYIYAVALSFAIIAALLLKDTKATPVPVNLAALGKLFMKPRLLWFLLVVLIISIPHRMNDSMLAIYLSELGASETQLGMAWFVATISTVPALFFVGKLIERWSALGIFIIGAVIYIIRWAIYSQTDNPSVLIAAQALHGLSFPLFFVASIHYLSTLVPNELRATGQAALAVTFGGLGGIIGSAAGGYTMDNFGPHTAFGAGSIFALVGTVAAVSTVLFHKRSATQQVQDS